uniref:Uncharacterized protein n=1 Tax=Anguilla anguilla TaxID=7936 RepID=A0A0E9TSP1_ANGAN
MEGKVNYLICIVTQCKEH